MFLCVLQSNQLLSLGHNGADNWWKFYKYWTKLCMLQELFQHKNKLVMHSHTSMDYFHFFLKSRHLTNHPNSDSEFQSWKNFLEDLHDAFYPFSIKIIYCWIWIAYDNVENCYGWSVNLPIIHSHLCNIINSRSQYSDKK